ncbi:MAG: inorganic phosphate transporter [Anaerolineae bacterium]|nr:inorganic phosphate transporter [Anaerolineae bacterium]
MSPILLAVIGLALVASFITGIHDSSNIATMISSRAYPPRLALFITAVAEFLGPLVFGVQVAKTIGRNIVTSNSITIQVILAALTSAILWILLTWFLRLPSSYSHALVGGFVGAVLVEAGWQAIQMNGLVTVLISLFVSPMIGFAMGWLLLTLLLRLSWNASPKVNNLFKRSQLVSVIALALGQGANDSAKSMGMITLAFMIEGYLHVFLVLPWVQVICALALALGTAFGGMRLIRTVGGKFYKIRPVDGFASQLASAGVIIGASLLGGPVSTTQVVSSSIMGAGASERINKVRWGIGRNIATAWLLTIPSSALLSAGLYSLFSRLIQ